MTTAALWCGPTPEEPVPQGNPFLPIRTRFFDDWLKRVTAQDGVRQVVLLAAGLDTRAFRLARRR
jgi:O-methyltransferase involved in polyketide biosynthesis